MNYLYCQQYESRCVSWEEDSDTIPSKSNMGCNDNDGNDHYVHLLSPCSPDESEYYLDSEEIEQCESWDDNSYISLDDRSYVSFDERSNPLSVQSSISTDSDYERREPSFSSESKKAVLFSQQSVPVLPSPYPHVRKTSSGYTRLSSSSLHPLQLHKTAQLRSKTKSNLTKAKLRRQLSPIYEKEKRKVKDQKHRGNRRRTNDTDSKQLLHKPLQQRVNLQNNDDRVCSHKKRRLDKKTEVLGKKPSTVFCYV